MICLIISEIAFCVGVFQLIRSVLKFSEEEELLNADAKLRILFSRFAKSMVVFAGSMILWALLFLF